jgi:hypothetical protein
VSPERSIVKPALLGILVAVVFVMIAAIRLADQGAYQDELHQASGVFAWRGGPLLNYAPMTVGGVPVLNMSYSGAIKTALFGLYLKWSGAAFSIVSWRLAGIFVGALSLASLFLLMGRRMPPVGRAVLAVFLLTDTSLVLLQRHDYGPVALGLLFRMLFVAVWMREALSRSADVRRYAVLGCIAGVATFEKASSIVLLVPLLLAVVTGVRAGLLRRSMAAATGLFVGLLPLLAINTYSYFQAGSFVSLTDVQPIDRSMSALASYAGALFSLGSGERAREFVLGEATRPGGKWMEALGLATLLVFAFVAMVQRARVDPLARFACGCLAAFVGSGLATWLLPGPTDAHHWILATPFQYVAIAAALSLWLRDRAGWTAWRVAVPIVLVLFLGNRAALVATTVNDLARGAASGAFDPSLTRLGAFVRAAGDENAFIAADWGVSTVMFCLADGPLDRVFEPYWFYSGAGELDPILALPTKQAFFVVTLRPQSGVRPAQTRLLIEDLERRAELVEVAPDPGLSALAAVDVRKFVRRTDYPATTAWEQWSGNVRARRASISDSGAPVRALNTPTSPNTDRRNTAIRAAASQGTGEVGE